MISIAKCNARDKYALDINKGIKNKPLTKDKTFAGRTHPQIKKYFNRHIISTRQFLVHNDSKQRKLQLMSAVTQMHISAHQQNFNTQSFPGSLPGTMLRHDRFGLAMFAEPRVLIAETGREQVRPAMANNNEVYIILNKDGKLFAGLHAHSQPWGKKDANFLGATNIKNIHRSTVLFDATDLEILNQEILSNACEDRFSGAVVVRVTDLSHNMQLNAGDFAKATLRADRFVINPNERVIAIQTHLTAAITRMSGQLETPINHFKNALSALARTNTIRVVNPRRPQTRRFG